MVGLFNDERLCGGELKRMAKDQHQQKLTSLCHSAISAFPESAADEPDPRVSLFAKSCRFPPMLECGVMKKEFVKADNQNDE